MEVKLVWPPVFKSWTDYWCHTNFAPIPSRALWETSFPVYDFMYIGWYRQAINVACHILYVLWTSFPCLVGPSRLVTLLLDCGSAAAAYLTEQSYLPSQLSAGRECRAYAYAACVRETTCLIILLWLSRQDPNGDLVTNLAIPNGGLTGKAILSPGYPPLKKKGVCTIWCEEKLFSIKNASDTEG